MSHKGSVKGISSQGKRCEFSSTPLATEQVIHQELYFNDSCLLTAGKIFHNKFQIDKHFHFEFSIILPWINYALNSNVNPNWYKALHISYLNQFSASSLSNVGPNLFDGIKYTLIWQSFFKAPNQGQGYQSFCCSQLIGASP